jgi:hypothetical protein
MWLLVSHLQVLSHLHRVLCAFQKLDEAFSDILFNVHDIQQMPDQQILPQQMHKWDQQAWRHSPSFYCLN